MSEARPTTGARPPAEDPKASIKGALIIAAAVLLGFVLLTKGFNSNGESSSVPVTVQAAGPGTTVDRDAPPPTTSPSQSSTITAPPTTRAPAEVTLIVSNGAGKAGVATKFSEQLKKAGYVVKDTANASVTPLSRVYYTDGFQTDAQGIAQLLGLTADAAQPMPSPAPVAGKSMTGVNAVVVIGTDKG